MSAPDDVAALKAEIERLKAELLKAKRADDLKQYPIPDNVPYDLWCTLVDHRREIKKPMTERAAKMMSKKLGDMAARGVNLRAAVEQTITAGWQDVYEPRNYSKPRGAGIDWFGADF